MCIIAYKPLNVAFPEERYLKNCFENNSDGAGFMYAYNNEVHIAKGFDTFKKFKNALDKARAITGDNVPYVMHFRIATQGYEKTMTHPFPLSSKMKNLYKLKCKCNIGIAHNGIIRLTSDGSRNYSDTMLFITDYLSLIIRSYTYYKDTRTIELIERLISNSRLAILDKNGTCNLLGEGWVEAFGCFFSNETYSYEHKAWTGWGKNGKAYSWDFDTGYTDDGCWAYPATTKKNHWDWYKDSTGSKYAFYDTYCPYTEDDDESYCEKCLRFGKCVYTTGIRKQLEGEVEAPEIIKEDNSVSKADVPATKKLKTPARVIYSTYGTEQKKLEELKKLAEQKKLETKNEQTKVS